MMIIPSGVKVHLALGQTDMRKGFDGLSMLVQDLLKEDPFSGHLFAFRGRRPTPSSCSTGTERGCACSPSDCSADVSSGPISPRQAARSCSRPRNWPC